MHNENRFLDTFRGHNIRPSIQTRTFSPQTCTLGHRQSQDALKFVRIFFAIFFTVFIGDNS